MPWTRTPALIASLGLSLACTRLNPAFDEEVGDDGSETRGESDTTTLGDDASTDDASTDDAIDDATTLTDDSTTEGTVADLPPGVCEDDLRSGLVLGFGDPFFFANTCPDTLEIRGLLHFDEGIQSLVLDRCEGDDSFCQGECGFEQHPVAVGFDVGTFVGGCVTVEVAHPMEGLDDVCSWGSFSMFPSENSNTPLAVAVTAGYPPVPAAAAALGGYPTLVQTSECACESLGINEPCCVDNSFGVLFFDFELPEQTFVTPGEAVVFDLGGAQFPYKFEAKQAQRIGDCGMVSPIDMSWAMLAQF